MPAYAATSPFVETMSPLAVSGEVSTTSETSPRSIISLDPHATNIQRLVRSHLARTQIRSKHTAATKIQSIVRARIAFKRRIRLTIEKKLKELQTPKRKWYHFTPSWSGAKTALTHAAIATAFLGAIYLKDLVLEESPLVEIAVSKWRNAGNRFYMNSSPDDYSRARNGLKLGLLNHIMQITLGISIVAAAKYVICNPKKVGQALLNAVLHRAF